MENIKICSSSEHGKENAISYCPKCDIYLCNKCEALHSKLLKHHETINLKNNNEELFTGFCQEKNHPMKLEFFCKDHNQLCCAVCISKIKKKEIGIHKDCNVVLIEEIKEEKIKKLNDNIQILEKLSENINESIKDIKIIFEKINTDKEKLILNIQNIFTKIRNELNNREDELLLEIENKYKKLYNINEDILKQSEKLPNKIKLSLEKGEKIDKENKDNNLSSNIYKCINIENNIKEINIINEKIKNCKNNYNKKLYFYPNKEEHIIKYIEKIKNFGKICLPSKIKDYNLTKSIKLNSGIRSIIVLSNNDIALGKRNGELMIFDSKEFKEIAKVQAHSGGNTSIYSLLELKDKTIMTCGGNKTMKNYNYNVKEKKLIELQELFCKDNSSYICRVIELPNNNLISSDNANIIIWQRDETNKFKKLKEITDFGGVMQHLTIMNDKYVICHNNSGVLRIYNSQENFKLEKEIKSIISYAEMHRFCIINSDLFCLSGDQYIYLFSISKMDLIQSLKIDNMNFHCILLLTNNTLLCGAFQTNNKTYHYFQFEISDNNEIKQLSMKEKVHSSTIWQFAHLEEKNNIEKIISVSDDCLMNIYELNYEN